MDYVNVRQPAFDVTATVSFAVRRKIRRYVFRTCMDYVNVRQPAFDVTATVSFAVRLQIRRYVFRTCMDYVNVRQPAFDDSSVRKSSEHRQTSQEGSV